MTARIPVIDLATQYRALRVGLEQAIREVLESGQYVLGPQVRQFEAALARRSGCRFAIGVNSGTDALELTLRACGIGPGDDVIVPALTFMATPLAVSTVGATPIIADIEEATYGMDAEDAARRITPRTRAIIPVHLYGQPCDLEGIMRLARRYRLRVIEDCAQAIGATFHGRPVGSFGTAGCFSFYPTKNLGAIGDGGAVVTRDRRIAERLRLLRNYGTQDKVRYTTFGRNSRLDELQAAVLLVKLTYLQRWNAARRERARWYREELRGLADGAIGLPQELPGRRHVYHAFVVRVRHRDRVQRQLARDGIQTMVYYANPVHLQSLYGGASHRHRRLPHAERAAREVLALPIYPELGRAAVRRVARQLLRAVA